MIPRFSTLGRPVIALIAVQVLSSFGDYALWSVMGVWVNKSTGSVGLAGMVAFALGISGLAGPWAGLLVDRLNRRRLLVGTHAGGAVTTLGLAASVESVPSVFVAATLLGGISLIASSAQSAILRDLVGPDEARLAVAGGIFRTFQQGLRIVAPTLGVVLYGVWGAPIVCCLDAATFLGASIWLWRLRLPAHLHDSSAPASKPRLRSWTEGARFIWSHPIMRSVVGSTAIGLIGVGMSSTLVFSVVRDTLHRAPNYVGYLESAVGVGAVLGAALAPLLVKRWGSASATAAALLTMALGFFLLIIPVSVVALMAMAIVGIGVPISLISMFTVVQTATPDHLQGRVYSTAQTCTSVPQVLAVLLGAALVPVAGANLSTLIIGAILLFACSIVLRTPRPGKDRRRTAAVESR